MKKFLDQSSWSRKAAIGSMLIMAFAFVGCDDSSSASVENSEPAALSSAEKQGSSSLGSVASAGSEASSSSRCAGASEECDEAISSDSNAESNGSSLSSSSEKLSVISSSSAGKAKSSSSVVTLATPCKTETEDNCEYGTVLDDRDGQTYKTVKIGDQWWMAENLNYYDSTNLSVKNKSWCYNDSTFYCEKYGRLYTWAASLDSAKLVTLNSIDCGYGHTCSLPTRVQGVCPTDWHLPGKAEWNSLITAVGGILTAGKALKSQSGWDSNGNGTDAFGFSALPVGVRHYGGYFDYESKDALFWTSTVDNASNANYMGLYSNWDDENLGPTKKNNGFSVRCVKD